MLKAIVFDFDGVIVDSEPLHYRAFLRTAESIGHTFTYADYLERYIGYDDRDAFRVMLGHPAGRAGDNGVEEQVAALVADKAEQFEAVVHAGIEPIPGMLDLIRDAAARLPIAIASGATRRDIDLILGKLNLASLFPDIVSADQVARSKPDPQTYALAVQRLATRHGGLGLKPGDCLAIEDTAAGVASARGAGLMTLGLATSGPPEALRQAQRVVASARGLTLAQLRLWFDD